MATRKLAIQICSNQRWSSPNFISTNSREFVISFQPQGYIWTVPDGTKFEVIYESNNPARSENELIEVREENNRTLLTIHSDEPVVQVVVNGVLELEAKIVNWPEQDYRKEAKQKPVKVEKTEIVEKSKPRKVIELGTRKLKVQHSLNKELSLGLEPLGWGWDVLSGELFEAIYAVYDFSSFMDSLYLNYIDKEGITDITIDSDDYPYAFYFDGKKFG